MLSQKQRFRLTTGDMRRLCTEKDFTLATSTHCPAPSRSWLQAGIEAGEAGIQRKALIHFESFADTFEGAGGDADLIIRALKSIPDLS